MNKTVRTVSKALKNPAVQRVLAWALPLIIGWIMSYMDKKSKGKRKR